MGTLKLDVEWVVLSTDMWVLSGTLLLFSQILIVGDTNIAKFTCYPFPPSLCLPCSAMAAVPLGKVTKEDQQQLE